MKIQYVIYIYNDPEISGFNNDAFHNEDVFVEYYFKNAI